MQDYHINKFKQFEPGVIGLSTITVSELQYGVAKSKYREKNQQRLLEFFAPFEILSYDKMAAGRLWRNPVSFNRSPNSPASSP